MSALQADILIGFSRMPKSYVCKTLPVRLIFIYCWGQAHGKCLLIGRQVCLSIRKVSQLYGDAPHL